VSFARLLVSCPDQPGIVAAVSRFLFTLGANITDSAQHSTGPTGGTFFMRTEFHLDGLDGRRAEIEDAFRSNVAARFAMDWSLALASG
jgi:formyltetrahydrofolate deformylase